MHSTGRHPQGHRGPPPTSRRTGDEHEVDLRPIDDLQVTVDRASPDRSRRRRREDRGRPAPPPATAVAGSASPPNAATRAANVVDRNGPLASARPISRNTSTSSARPQPTPPVMLGETQCEPSQLGGQRPRLCVDVRRVPDEPHVRAMGTVPARNCAADEMISSCSGDGRRSISAATRALVADDVALDLGRATADRASRTMPGSGRPSGRRHRQ